MTRTSLVLIVIIAIILTWVGLDRYFKRVQAEAANPGSASTQQANPASAQQVGAGPRIAVDDRVKLLMYFEQAQINGVEARDRAVDLCAKDSACNHSQDAQKKAIKDFQDLQKEITAKLKLPPGTAFNVDANQGAVSIVTPPPAAPVAQPPASK